ncbi:Uncharacterised protein [Mycobacteroides abscessus subsp. abscessus]|nr:Uncharacterised protein [Mycobacteroides abscessus subsp. abscessus]
MACDLSLPSSTERTELMCDICETEVRPRMAVSMVLPKSGESIVNAMFSEPRLQEMSLPISL